MRSTRHLIRFASVSALLLAGAFSARTARAEADTFGLGSGRTGAGTIGGANTIVNAYAAITADVATAATTVNVDDGTVFSPGDLVLLWKTTGVAAAVSGDQTAVALNGVATGSFEYGRVKSIAGNVVTLTNPIVSAFGFTGGQSQMVKVPEYTTLSITGSIVAPPWDGTKGGIVAVFATGAITNAGTISVDQSGFRGGLTNNDATIFSCAALDGPVVDSLVPSGHNPLAGGAKKGEGLFPADFSLVVTNPTGAANAVTYGRGNITSGAGGGDCSNSGGGGGGHGAAGGQGGGTWGGETNLLGMNTGDRMVGGIGGAPVSYDPLMRLTFGGGGGAGEENNDDGTNGGAGAGVVIIRGLSLAGAGTITANGESAGTSTIDGAGGGGAGGLIVVRVSGDATCGGLQANGGGGGHCATNHGPGAGGAGGVILLQSATNSCMATESPGPQGDDGTDAGRGSDPGNGGTTVTPPSGGYTPPPCTVADNQCGGCVVNTDCGPSGTCDTTTNACTLPDGGSLDAGSGSSDAGSSDGGSSTSDGGVTDGGSSTSDGGSSDGGSFDGGFASDGGSTTGDGGSGNGNGVTDDGGDLEGGGCSTSGSSSDGEGAALLGLGLVAALAWMRRKKR